MSTNVTETALQRERRLYRELSSRLVDLVVSKVFDLRPESAMQRRTYLFAFFILSGFLISLIYYPLQLWLEHLRDIFYSILNPGIARFPADIAFGNFFNFILQIILDSRILQYLPVFIAPFFIAQQSAAIYLADIFELEDISVARAFVSGVALTGSDSTIRIRHGEVIEEHQETPLYLIGGPGKVVVELDSVALFERADGTPHVIGPTGKNPGGRASLDGFERFRHAFDIRNHHIELRDQDEKSKAVRSKSRDGIPIKATDVRLTFSIFRGENAEPSAENPYPFNEEAVKQIVYKAASKVTPEQSFPSTYDFNWTSKMPGMIRGKLASFMSQHNLSEYLASIGMPEFEKAKKREDIIFEQIQRLSHTDDDSSGRKEIKLPPEFQSRDKLKSLFAQFADGFSSQARESGVELHWIGVGTWESPLEIVPDRHLDAWKQTQINMKSDTPGAMIAIENTEALKTTKDLIRKAPIALYFDLINKEKTFFTAGKDASAEQFFWSYDDGAEEEDDEEGEEDRLAEMLNILHDLHGDKKKDNEEKQTVSVDHAHAAQALLLEYRKLLQEAVDFIKAKNESVPQNIRDAIKYINNQIGHWAGNP